jgi:serralysin
LYLAAFRRVPDASGLDNWVSYARAGNSLQSAADAFVASPEFQLTYGSLDDTQYVTLLYENVLGRGPDPAGLANWVAQLGAGATRGQVLIGFSESKEGIGLFAPTVRTFLHYFTFLNSTPAQSDLDYWENYLTTLDGQMRDDLLADPAFTNGG